MSFQLLFQTKAIKQSKIITAFLNILIHYFVFSLYEIQTTPYSELFCNNALLEKDKSNVVLFKHTLKHLKSGKS